MPSRYEKAPVEAHEILDQLVELYHKDHYAIGTKFDILMAYAPENDEGEKTGTALKMHGYPCNGVARIVGLKERVKGCGDAEIILDGDTWPGLEPEQQSAIIDHELCHFVIRRNLQGEVLNDTHGRPKLRMRLHDVQHGWFREVAMRHGDASPEIDQAKKLFTDEIGQVFFPFIPKSSKPKAIKQ
jgi:hypothetical protein